MTASRECDSPQSVLKPQTILVESLGMQHWLNMQLADLSGIAMNLQFPMPTRFMWQVARHILGDDQVPLQSTYKREVLAWRLYRLFQQESFLQQGEFSDLRNYLLALQQRSSTKANASVFEFATAIADVFEQYMLYRPDWLFAWESHDTVTNDEHGADIEQWQAALWRALVAIEPLHPAALHRQAINALASAKRDQLDGLPANIYVFALNTMAPQLVEFFSALANHCDIHIFHLNPCMDYWGDLQTDRARARATQLATWLDESSPNPMLANMGQQGRDLFNLLQQQQLFEIGAFENPLEQPKPLDNLSPTLLQQVQSAIFNGVRRLPDMPQNEADSSVTIVATHSPLRELQSLHDHLLAQFQQDPTLRPQDVLVMCPAIEDYTPYISAVFSTRRTVTSEEARLPCSVADRAPLDSIPEIAMFMRLLELPDSRFEVTAIIEYLRTEAIATHFSIQPQELQLLEQWLAAANVRWGLDQEHKRNILQQGDVSLVVEDDGELRKYSWKWGLQRLLLGLLHIDSAVLIDGTLTVPDVEGIAAEALGKLCWLLELLEEHRGNLQKPRTIPQWQAYLHQLKQSVFGDLSNSTRAAMLLERGISELTTHAEMADFTQPIGLAELRIALRGQFAQPDVINQFMTGQVTFCSMLPMRSIPFKIIALLGLNDGDYPRPSQALSVDLMQHQPRRLGDRSRRGDDRYLFLEAIVSARKQIYLSYQARQVKDNSERQPSLVLREFQSYLDSDYGIQGSIPVYRYYATSLHAFSAQNFQQSQATMLNSYDAGWFKLASALQQRNKFKPTIQWPIRAASPLTLSPGELTRAFRDPLKYFANQGLGLYLDQQEPLLQDVEPFTIDNLTRHNLLHELLDQALSGAEEGSYSRITEHYFADGAVPKNPVVEQTLIEWQQAIIALRETIGGEPCEQIQGRYQYENTTLQGTIAGYNLAVGSILGTTLHWHIREFAARQHMQNRIEQMLCSIALDKEVDGVGYCLNHKDTEIQIDHIVYETVTPTQAKQCLDLLLDRLIYLQQSPCYWFIDLAAVVCQQEPLQDTTSLWQAIEKQTTPQPMQTTLADSPYWQRFNPDNQLPDFNELTAMYEVFRPFLSAHKKLRKQNKGRA